MKRRRCNRAFGAYERLGLVVDAREYRHKSVPTEKKVGVRQLTRHRPYQKESRLQVRLFFLRLRTMLLLLAA